MHRCNNKNQCLRKKLNRFRRRQEEVEEEEEEVEVGVEEVVEQKEKIDAKHHYFLHKY